MTGKMKSPFFLFPSLFSFFPLGVPVRKGSCQVVPPLTFVGRAWDSLFLPSAPTSFYSPPRRLRKEWAGRFSSARSSPSLPRYAKRWFFSLAVFGRESISSPVGFSPISLSWADEAAFLLFPFSLSPAFPSPFLDEKLRRFVFSLLATFLSLFIIKFLVFFFGRSFFPFLHSLGLLHQCVRKNRGRFLPFPLPPPPLVRGERNRAHMLAFFSLHSGRIVFSLHPPFSSE